MTNYKIEYLPVAKEDMLEIVDYISHKLSNPDAANRLAQDMVDSADSLSDFPYMGASYIPLRPLKHEYRKLLVKNYIMFYWVDDENKTVTIARVLYARRNFDALLS